MTNNKQTLDIANALFQKRMDEFGGDYVEYMRKYKSLPYFPAE